MMPSIERRQDPRTAAKIENRLCPDQMGEDRGTDREVVVVAFAVHNGQYVWIGRKVVEGIFVGVDARRTLACDQAMQLGDVRRREAVTLPFVVGGIGCKGS